MVDLIDRGKLIAELQWLKEQEYEAVGDMWDDIIERVRKQPVAEVRGHWIEDEYGYMHCSECIFEHDSPEYVTQFCPMCGAKMDEETRQ